MSSHSPIPDVGARLPADAPVVVTEEEIDWARSISGTDATGQPSITLRLRPEAALAFRQYTATHIGEMVAIAVDGQIVSVPTINEQIEGEVSISGLPGSGDLEPLRRCVPDA